MNYSSQVARASHFRDLNLRGRLLLPNAWDAASARVFEQAGFKAVGTTSAGIANARGLPDGEQIGRDAMLREIAAIVDSVDVPVNADIEAGYGGAPADVEETVMAALDLGISGINVEDRAHGSEDSPILSVDDQAARLRAARVAADRRRVPLVVNARTDTFLLAIGSSLDERVSATIARGRAYLEAGADLVFIPGLIDLDVIRQVVRGIGGPVSVMALPGAPAADDMFAAGARRVSLGSFAMLAALGAVREIARDVLSTGEWGSMERTFFGFSDAEALFSRRTAERVKP